MEFLENIPDELEKIIADGHVLYEAEHGIVCHHQRFGFVTRDENGEIIGALFAYKAFAEIYVDDLWVKENLRNQGVGTALLEALEKRFQGEGFNNISLVTYQFQAPEFYKKCGFSLEFIRKNVQHPKLTKFFFIKYFNEEREMQGVL